MFFLQIYYLFLEQQKKMKKITLSEQKLLSIIKKTISEIRLNETAGCPGEGVAQTCSNTENKGYCCPPYACCNLNNTMRICCRQVPRAPGDDSTK